MTLCIINTKVLYNENIYVAIKVLCYMLLPLRGGNSTLLKVKKNSVLFEWFVWCYKLHIW